MQDQQLGLRLSQRRAGVLGRPIEHSLSPVLHTAAYRALGLSWSYEAIDCGVDELPAVLAARSDWAGFSATMPLKHALLDVAAQVEPLAEAVGAANTLIPGARGWTADNTDVAGIVGALAEANVHAEAATVLGAGGTAQAVVAALARLGLGECTVLVRDPARTAALAGTAERVNMRLHVGRLSPAAVELGAPLVISTLPPGAADPLADRDWTPRQVLLDVVYAPWPTQLAAAATGRGTPVIGGAAMLLHQAAAQVRLMTGSAPPVAAMRAALKIAIEAPRRPERT